ncbi:MAG: hypothetical protein M3121_05250 [Chloroflexota bacterium]|nr:hypothetical protein [Chloroflexota bacterium]
MYGSFTTWRIHEDHQNGAAWEQLFNDVSVLWAALSRSVGLVGGYAVRVGPDTLVALGVYASAEAARAGEAAVEPLRTATVGRLELAGRRIGPAYDVCWSLT